MFYNKIELHPVPTALQTAQYKHSLSALTYALVKQCERNRCTTASPYVSSTKTDFRGTIFIFKGSRLLKITFTLPTRFPLSFLRGSGLVHGQAVPVMPPQILSVTKRGPT